MTTTSLQPDNRLKPIPVHTFNKIDKTNVATNVNQTNVSNQLPDDLDPETDELAWKEWLLFEAWRVGIVE